MNLEVALQTFEAKHEKFLTSDREKIVEVVSELKLIKSVFSVFDAYVFDTAWSTYDGFSAEQRSTFSQTPYFRLEDMQGTIRIHPWMIVAKKRYVGSRDRGKTPLAFHRHFYELSRWKDKNQGNLSNIIESTQVLCPNLFLWVPAYTECQCGDSHAKSHLD